MNQSIRITTALCLASADISALATGRMIAALPQIFLRSGQQFMLYPVHESANLVPESDQQATLLSIWARCELCQILSEETQLKGLANLTVWTAETLLHLQKQQKHVFLAHLRIYKIPTPISVPSNLASKENIGKFVGLPDAHAVNEDYPVLSDSIFSRRKHQLENLEPPLYPELEELHGTVAQLAISNPAVRQLEKNIQVFLSWADSTSLQQSNPDLEWIKTIDELGNRSKEQDDGRKSNYQAGTDFENIVKKSLGFLGFTVDEAYRGGAGGLDLFCSQPYPLVGECKAGKKIPSGTTEELVKLGGMHLDADRFLKSAKLIIGPGEPTPDVLTAADKWRVSIIKPMTLQKLAELQAKYPGSINLIALREYLEPGKIDSKIEQYIATVEKDIALREKIIQSAKQLTRPDRKHLEVVEIKTYYNVKFAEANGDPELDDLTVHEILIELSSPLTGYLGRIRGTSLKTDRFYFLRDLAIA